MIVSITNQKGGCGKTTTAQALTAGLRDRGFKVLAVDADPQTNFTYSAGVAEANGTLNDVFTGARLAKDCITATQAGYDIIAGSVYLSAFERNSEAQGRESILKNALQQIAGSYDYIIIDTPPQLGLLTANAMNASNCVIVPMGADIYSIQGLSQLQGMLANARKQNKELYIDGLLITRFTARTIINRQLKKDLERIANRLNTRVYKVAIREATAVKECQLMKTDLFREYPKANVTKDYAAFIDEFLKARK